MRFLEQAIFQLIPSIRIRPRWRTLWEQRERRAFRTNAYYFFSFFAIAYLAHFYLIDKPLHKVPIELWAKYRFGLAAVGIFGLAFTYFWHQRVRYFKLPLALAGWLYTYMQAQSMIWRSEIPYSYAVVLPCIAALALRSSVASTLIFLAICFGSEYRAWNSRPEQMPYILSAAIVGAILVTLFRSRMTSDVDAFISEQERIEAQQEVIEAHRETTDQIRAFLPKEIYRRVETIMQRERKTVVQAMDEVLRPREDCVTVLYSDIRGFTHLTKSVGGFATNAAIPNMKASTEIVENYRGIPRPIGDLIFAYFDSFFDQDNPGESFHRGIQAAIALTKKNESLNATLPNAQRIRKYVLLSFGLAIVGNIGGTESAREITAFGDPANVLSRIDSVTKEPKVQDHFTTSLLVFSSLASRVASVLFPSLNWNVISLSNIGLSVRDFPEETCLHLLPLTESNLKTLRLAPPGGYNIDYSRFLLKPEIERKVA